MKTEESEEERYHTRNSFKKIHSFAQFFESKITARKTKLIFPLLADSNN
jgi:hypothetical protein